MTDTIATGTPNCVIPITRIITADGVSTISFKIWAKNPDSEQLPLLEQRIQDTVNEKIIPMIEELGPLDLSLGNKRRVTTEAGGFAVRTNLSLHGGLTITNLASEVLYALGIGGLIDELTSDLTTDFGELTEEDFADLDLEAVLLP